MFNRILNFRIGAGFCLLLATLTGLTSVMACSAVCPVETAREETPFEVSVGEWPGGNDAVCPASPISLCWRVLTHRSVHIDVRLSGTPFPKTSKHRPRFDTIAPTAYDYG